MALSLSALGNQVMQDASEGILIVDFDGVVTYANPAAHRLLGFAEGKMTGGAFASLFLEEGKDEFVEAVLEAVYDQEHTHRAVVRYTLKDRHLYLRVTTSFLKEGDELQGVIAFFDDLSDLDEMQDVLKSMETVRALNEKLMLRNDLLRYFFGRYMSDDVVRQMLRAPRGLALGGTKQRLTIMMSDLRGFTALSEQMDAADLIAMLNHYLGEMTEVIQRWKGTIIEFIGDGIMAVFGAPVALSCHEENAVAAAVEMEMRMREVNRWNDAHGFPALEMGIGVHTGEVIVGNIGSQQRTKYGVVGNHVNLCGRVESYTVGGQILISEDTRNGVSAELIVRNIMRVSPKGAAREMQLFDVAGMGAPYYLHVDRQEEKLRPLSLARPVAFSLIVDKHRQPERLSGSLVAVAENGAVLETEAPLEPLANLLLETGGDLYCKVMKKTDKGYLLRYTSVPREYAEWLKK